MRKMMVLAVAAVLVGAVGIRAQDAPKPPQPQKEHEWLKQLEGEWENDHVALLGPGKEPLRSKGTERVRLLGGFWAVSEFQGVCPMGLPLTGQLTIGYDPQKKKYVATWVCSVCDQLWKYEGTVDGKVLTLETEAPNPATGKPMKMRDVIEIKDRDHKVLTLAAQGENGQWITFMTITSHRKK
jgi:hypothetical protein